MLEHNLSSPNVLATTTAVLCVAASFFKAHDFSERVKLHGLQLVIYIIYLHIHLIREATSNFGMFVW